MFEFYGQNMVIGLYNSETSKNSKGWLKGIQRDYTYRCEGESLNDTSFEFKAWMLMLLVGSGIYELYAMM